MSFMNRRRDVRSEDVANIPPELSDLHCFTETGGVITTSKEPFPTPGPPHAQAED
ncbi:hypothetical protein LX36DRAFT_655314 [Colletotrichum falcatum]|nr:hypothetical protein LX36DRAFT_655314 [Colletotrichum falcatum]